MIIWSYWEGPRPEYISVCLDSMSRNLKNSFRLITPETLLSVVPENIIHPNWKNLDQIALRVDCIRAALLAENGGWWWDADTICLRSPDTIDGSCPSSNSLYMVWDKTPFRILNGYIRLSKDLAGQWLEKINRKLSDEFSDIKWCSLGEEILTPLLRDDPDTLRISRKLFLPVDIDSNVEDFFKPRNPFSYVDDNTICFGLNHSYFMYHHADKMQKSQWNNSPLLIHRLLNLADL